MKKTSDGLSLQLVLNNKFTTPFFYYKITPNYRSYFMSTKASLTEVFCSFQLDGIHFWENCDIPEVSYLKHPHRHMFGFKCYMTVSHSDRNIEFIKLKHAIIEYLTAKYFNIGFNSHMFGGQSCEMIATEIGEKFSLSRCEVNEDGENGSIVYFD